MGIYIMATATSDTELVTDSVVILILTEVDEKFFELLEAHCSSWMNKVFKANKQEQKEEEKDKRGAEKEGEKRQEKGEEKQEDDQLAVLKRENSEFKKKMETFSNTITRMEFE